MFFKIGVLKNFKNVFSSEYCKIFNSIILENFWWLFFSIRQSNCSVLGICWPSLLYQKHSVGWFLLKRFVDMFRVRILLVETMQTRFCWLTCRKQKIVQSKTMQQRVFVLISDFWQFRHPNFSWGKSNIKKI